MTRRHWGFLLYSRFVPMYTHLWYQRFKNARERVIGLELTYQAWLSLSLSLCISTHAHVCRLPYTCTWGVSGTMSAAWHAVLGIKLHGSQGEGRVIYILFSRNSAPLGALQIVGKGEEPKLSSYLWLYDTREGRMLWYSAPPPLHPFLIKTVTDANKLPWVQWNQW